MSQSSVISVSEPVEQQPINPDPLTDVQVARPSPPVEQEDYSPTSWDELKDAMVTLLGQIPNVDTIDFYARFKSMVEEEKLSTTDSNRMAREALRKKINQILLEQQTKAHLRGHKKIADVGELLGLSYGGVHKLQAQGLAKMVLNRAVENNKFDALVSEVEASAEKILNALEETPGIDVKELSQQLGVAKDHIRALDTRVKVDKVLAKLRKYKETANGFLDKYNELLQSTYEDVVKGLIDEKNLSLILAYGLAVDRSVVDKMEPATAEMVTAFSDLFEDIAEDLASSAVVSLVHADPDDLEDYEKEVVAVHKASRDTQTELDKLEAELKKAQGAKADAEISLDSARKEYETSDPNAANFEEIALGVPDAEARLDIAQDKIVDIHSRIKSVESRHNQKTGMNYINGLVNVVMDLPRSELRSALEDVSPSMVAELPSFQKKLEPFMQQADKLAKAPLDVVAAIRTGEKIEIA
jgi:hypothetical protein